MAVIIIVRLAAQRLLILTAAPADAAAMAAAIQRLNVPLARLIAR